MLRGIVGFGATHPLLWFGAGMLTGYMLTNKLGKVPGVSKLPQAGN